MPLIHRTVGPKKLSSGKLELKGKTDSEFIAVNNETLVNILRQLASVVTHAGDVFSGVATLTEQVSKRVRSVKLRLDELEAKADLFDPRLVPVPEGTIEEVANCQTQNRIRGEVIFHTNLLIKPTRPRFLIQLFDNAGSHQPVFPPRSPLLGSQSRRALERQISLDSRRPASFAALRDWKLDDYLDEKIATLDRKKQSAEQLNRALASPFPSQVVQVDVTGAGFDRMKANRRSLVVHTKKIRKKRRNTICGSMPNKECGIQTSFTSVASPGGTGDEDGEHGDDDHHEHLHHHLHDPRLKKYGIDSGHWSSCTSSAQGVPGVPSSSSAPSPWDPNSLSTSSDFLFDDEDRCLTPQLENFTDGLVSDSDSVDTDGYFTSFRSDCGFPRVKKGTSMKELEDMKDEATSISSAGMLGSDKLFGHGGASRSSSSVLTIDDNTTVSGSTSGASYGGVGGTTTSFMMSSAGSSANTTVITANIENEYELFGKGSTSTTASSCGTVVLRSKPDPPARTIIPPEASQLGEKKAQNQNEDVGLEERVKRKSLIERVPSMVVVTPSPSCSSGSPPPLKDPGTVLHLEVGDDSEHDSGRITPKAEDLLTTNESECGTLSDTDSDRRTEVRLSDIAIKKRSTSSTSSTGTASTSNSTLTLTSCAISSTSGLPQPDVIPDAIQQLQIIRTNKPTPRLDANKEYYSLDTVLLGSFEEEQNGKMNHQLATSGDHAKFGIVSNGHVKVADGKCKESAIPVDSNASCVSPTGAATSGKVRGARVVLDANGEIIFSSETLRRKRKHKVSFDPGVAVKSPDYETNTTYARVRESVYDRIKKDTNDPEKLYECIEEIRRHNLQVRDPFLEVQQLKQERNSLGSVMRQDGSTRCASASSTSSSHSKSRSTPEGSDKSSVLLETDLDSAIPPVMPDLKNLPKIKDRLKRNESYRIANTDDVPPPNSSPNGVSPGAKNGKTLNGNVNTPPSVTTPTTPSRSPLSPLHLNRNGTSSKRMSFLSPTSSPSGNTALHLNKKRDIPEEDPNFIQQIFSMNSAANSQLNSSANNNGHNHSSSLLRSPLESLTGRITLSKFTLSPEDRPSFLRRDSPPTMDEIAKEIYRFRKKFNIQPNGQTSTTGTLPRSQVTSPAGASGNFAGGSLRRPPMRDQTSQPIPRSSSSIGHYNMSSSVGNSLPRSSTISTMPKSTIPEGFPKLSLESPPRPQFSTSTPRRPMSSCQMGNPSPAPSPIYYPSYGWGPASVQTPPPQPHYVTNGAKERMAQMNDSPNGVIPPVPPTRAFGSGRKIFPLKPSTPPSVHSMTNPSATNERLGYLSSNSASNPDSNYNGSLNNNNNNNYKTINILPSLPFRRNSMAIVESSSLSGLTSGRLTTRPRTSLGDFKKLLQATQKKRNSISAVEILKPKGLETTL